MRDGEALAIARSRCPICRGFGQRRARNGPDGEARWQICVCVWRGVFRASLGRYFLESARMAEPSSWVVELMQGHGGAHGYANGNKRAEYCADFSLVARQPLDAAERRIFDLHCIEERPWHECSTQADANARKYSNARKYFFDALYRIEAAAGRALVDAGMYPFGKYFGGHFVAREAIARSAGVRAAINKAKRTPWRDLRPNYMPARRAA